MKSIIYTFITLIISSIFVSSIPMSSKKDKNVITLQGLDNKATLEMLTKSAMIFENRLMSINSEEIEITLNPKKNQIHIKFNENWDLKLAESLLLHKGSLRFYETYNHESLLKLLNGKNHLFSLLNDVVVNNSNAKIACTPNSELEKINEYLRSINLDHKCKFVWTSASENTDACLYALKLNADGEALLTNSDINTVTSSQTDSMHCSLNIEFKESAVEKWSKATEKNIGDAIAIVLDNQVLSAPILKSVINNGKCSITGNFNQNEAKFFAAIGNNGELALDFKIIK